MNIAMLANRFIKSIVSLIICILILIQPEMDAVAQNGGTNDIARQSAQLLLEKLSTAQRVGQLFVITFKGTELNPESQIYDLIANHHIGGIVLKRANNNFAGPKDTISEVYRLNTTLQNIALKNFPSTAKTAIPLPSMDAEDQESLVSIPLFIGISQEGDLGPFDQIINGLTPIPNMMAVGATWNTALAEGVGNILGGELQALGFNMYLGPCLDVLDITYTEGGDNLGTRTFGGDPFWVSQMGKAFIRGLHAGSGSKIAVIAKHFPGRGGSDRLPEEEVATVRKSLDQLKLIELAPFFAVTGQVLDATGTADGLYLSHIRYQGLQGNIRATTKPISFDSAALDLLLDLEELSTWREGNHVIVSDDLGSQAVRKFFDPDDRSFDARQIVRNAFLAGNDLLYMDQIISSDDEDTYETVINILDYFIQKYNEDRAFAERVDSSVLRILSLKYQLYGSFEPQFVIPTSQNLLKIGKDTGIIFEVAQQAVTLISPDHADLISTLPQPPQLRERIIFFTDEMNTRQCDTCETQTIPDISAFQDAVVNLYGSTTGGQISTSRLSSYSFKDLFNFLDTPLNYLDLQSNLSKANWVIFAVLQDDQQRPESLVLHRILSERMDLIRNKNVIVFAFNIPYQLDATEISNVTAYYGVFSRIPSFIDIAARVLFQEITPVGSSPVSIPGVAYDLVNVTTPNPMQVIPLNIDINPLSPLITTPGAPVVTQEPTFQLGDIILLQTGVILDQNDHPVPDGTVVKFFFTLMGEKRINQIIEATTRDGIARTTFRIQDEGMLEISVTSEPALNSEILQLDISLGKDVVVSAITPTINPALREEALTPGLTQSKARPNSFSYLSPFLEWVILMIIIWGLGIITLLIGSRVHHVKWAVHTGLLSIVFGFIPPLWVWMGLPGSDFHYYSMGWLKLILYSVLFSGCAILYLWWKRSTNDIQ